MGERLWVMSDEMIFLNKNNRTNRAKSKPRKQQTKLFLQQRWVYRFFCFCAHVF